MKKILISVSTLTGGGAERVASVWANELVDAGYDVSLLLYGRCENEYLVDDRVRICTVASDYPAFKAMSYIERLKRMRRIVKDISPDAAISFLPRMQIWMMVATFGRNLRRIETIRVSPWHINISTSIEKFLWKLTYLRADAVIFQTAEQAEFFSKSVRKKGVVVSNSITEKYTINPKQTYSERSRHFVAAGRITEQKNYPLMIEAFANAVKKHSDLHLSIYGVGEESYTAKLKELIGKLGVSDNVKLMGRSTDMLTVLQNADAFIMTSDYEGMPNALAEAMTVGLPCISTNCRTGPKDMIDDGVSGFLTKVGDVEEASEAIIKITEMSKDEAESMGSAAREKIMDLCGKEKSLNQLIKVIENK